MTHKPRLDIILGATYTFSDIEGLAALSAAFDVTFHAFETPIIHHLINPAQLKIYAVIEDMPSYMRGIEPELAQTDAILALGNQNISSFQACRAADQLQVPFFLIVDEMREVTKEQYGHIYVLQSEVLRLAEKVYPLADTIRHNLIAAGCVKGKVKTIPPFISSKRYLFDSAKRKKFRDYLQLSQDKVLVLFNQPLRSGFQPRLAMEWLRYLRGEDEALFQQTVVLYCKSGELSRSLKSEALNHDLVAHVRFLDQDTAGFVRDLYSAADMVLANGIPCEDHLVEIFPRWQVEMIACGIVPIYPAANPVKKLIKKTIHHHHDHDLDEIYSAVKTFVARRKVDSRETLAAKQQQVISQVLAQDKTMAMIAEDITKAISGSGKAAASQSEATESPPAEPIKASSVHGKGILTIVTKDTPHARLREDYEKALKADDIVEGLTTLEKLIDLTRSEPVTQADYYFKKAELQLKLQADPFASGAPAGSGPDSPQTVASEESLEICLGLDPDHRDARFTLGKLLYESDRIAEAIGILTERQPSSDQLSFLLAQCQQADGKLAEASAGYIELMRKDYQPQVMATRLCRLLEEFPVSIEEKIATLKAAFVIDPSIRVLRQNLMAAFLTAGSVEEGKAWLEEQDAHAENEALLDESPEVLPSGRKKAS